MRNRYLSKYQLKRFFDIYYKFVDNKGFDASILKNIENDIKNIYNNNKFSSTRDVRIVEVRKFEENLKCNRHSSR
jgi:hypothetical protein